MKAVIIGVSDDVKKESFIEEINELENLSNACMIDVLYTVFQNVEYPHPLSYVGSGKVEEIKMLVDTEDIDVCVFNDELTPVQISFLAEKLDCLIYDRTYLVLEIFKKRAKTKEAIIQVEIASLKYLYPRLQGMRKGLSRQGGKGKGETKLELDRRINADKITELKRQLKELEKVRRVQREKRKKNNIKQVCLCGYTNSGKSTIMNTLLTLVNQKEEKKVFEKDMLFATLETSSRKIAHKNGTFILTDTVGFIEKLPTSLIEAFKSTLEEIKECDLIVHVVDASNPNHLNQIIQTNKVLEELDVKNIDVIYVFNKIDKLDSYLYIPNDYAQGIKISAKEHKNIDLLLDLIFSKIYKDYIQTKFVLPYSMYKDTYKIKDKSNNFEIEYVDDKIIINCLTTNEIRNIYNEYIQNE